MRDDRVRLQDIQEAIERIEKYARQGQEAFEHEELIQTWIVHHLQIIGGAARALSSELKDQHPEMPWSNIIGMRNILVHDYFGIDVDVVWAARVGWGEVRTPTLRGGRGGVGVASSARQAGSSMTLAFLRHPNLHLMALVSAAR